jgi:glucosamine-phosphate N-acetyltransferase
MNALNSVAESAGCYKTILNCGEQKKEFYAKCGYHPSGLEMVHHIGAFRTPQSD